MTQSIKSDKQSKVSRSSLTDSLILSLSLLALVAAWATDITRPLAHAQKLDSASRMPASMRSK